MEHIALPLLLLVLASISVWRSLAADRLLSAEQRQAIHALAHPPGWMLALLAAPVVALLAAVLLFPGLRSQLAPAGAAIPLAAMMLVLALLGIRWRRGRLAAASVDPRYRQITLQSDLLLGAIVIVTALQILLLIG